MNTGYTSIEADEPAPVGGSGANRNDVNIPGPISRSTNPNDWTWSEKLKESSHPVALLFYLFFRLSPIVFYLFGNILLGIFVSERKFILHFIVIILLVAADFWNLKNIAGRLLVGLRWWNEISFEGENRSSSSNVWVFETADPNRYINPIDSKAFWTLLYVQPVAWFVLSFMALLKLQFLYLLLTVISIILSLTNCFAFTKCDKFGKANSLASDLLSRTTGNLIGRLNPFA